MHVGPGIPSVSHPFVSLECWPIHLDLLHSLEASVAAWAGRPFATISVITCWVCRRAGALVPVGWENAIGGKAFSIMFCIMIWCIWAFCISIISTMSRESNVIVSKRQRAKGMSLGYVLQYEVPGALKFNKAVHMGFWKGLSYSAVSKYTSICLAKDCPLCQLLTRMFEAQTVCRLPGQLDFIFFLLQWNPQGFLKWKTLLCFQILLPTCSSG